MAPLLPAWQQAGERDVEKTGGQARAVPLPLQGCDDPSKCQSPEGNPASSLFAVGE